MNMNRALLQLSTFGIFLLSMLTLCLNSSVQVQAQETPMSNGNNCWQKEANHTFCIKDNSNNAKKQYCYDLLYEQIISDVQTSQGRNFAQVTIRPLSLKGDVKQNGHNAERLILANTPVKAKVQMQGTDGKLLGSAKKFSGKIPAENPFQPMSWRYEYPNVNAGSGCLLQITEVTFDFKHQESKLTNQFKILSDYHAQVRAMKSDNQYIRNIDLNNLNQLIQQVDFLDKMPDKLTKYDSFNFSTLDIAADDPNNFDNVLDDLVATYNESVQNLPQLYHDKGLQYKTYDKLTAQKYFKAAQTLNPNFDEPIYESAQLNLSDDNVQFAVAEAQKLKKINSPRTPLLTKEIYNWYLARAEKEMKHPSDYGKAIVIFDNARKALCTDGLMDNCEAVVGKDEERLSGMISQQKETQYSSFLNAGIAKAQQKDHQGAMDDIYQAMDFQSLNREWIPTNELAMKALVETYCIGTDNGFEAFNADKLATAQEAFYNMWEMENDFNALKYDIKDTDCGKKLTLGFENLYRAYILNGNKATEKNDFETANTNFDAAQALCNDKVVKCKDEVDKSINRANVGYYNAIVDESLALVQQGNYNDALNQLTEAEEICNSDKSITCSNKMVEGLFNSYMELGNVLAVKGDYDAANQNYKAATDVINKYQPMNVNQLNDKAKIAMQNSGRGSILQKVQQGNQALNKGDTKRASELKDEAMRMRNQYHLQNDNTTNSEIAGLETNLLLQECIESTSEFDKLQKEAQQLSKKGDYLAANERIQQSIDLSKKNAKCDLNTGEATKFKQEMAAATKYQKDIANAHESAKKGQFDQAVSSYKTAGRDFKNNELDKKYKLKHAPLSDFVRESTNPEFKVYAVNYFRHENDVDGVIATLKNLANYKDAKKHFEASGRKLALWDTKNSEYSDKTEAIKQYKMDKFPIYKHFRCGYYKQWNKSKNKARK